MKEEQTIITLPSHWVTSTFNAVKNTAPTFPEWDLRIEPWEDHKKGPNLLSMDITLLKLAHERGILGQILDVVNIAMWMTDGKVQVEFNASFPDPCSGKYGFRINLALATSKESSRLCRKIRSVMQDRVSNDDLVVAQGTWKEEEPEKIENLKWDKHQEADRKAGR